MQWQKCTYNPVADFTVVGNILMVHANLVDMPIEDLNDIISQFMTKIRKERGEQYPGKTRISV